MAEKVFSSEERKKGGRTEKPPTMQQASTLAEKQLDANCIFEKIS